MERRRGAGVYLAGTITHHAHIMKKTILAILLAASSVVMISTANAQVSVNINVGGPPPPVRYEPVPPPRSGWFWAPGYWDWNGRAHVWHRGRWLRQRPGYSYAQPAWREGPRGWELQRGGWHGAPPPARRAPPPPNYREREHGRDHDRDRGHGHGPRHCPPGHQRKGECD